MESAGVVFYKLSPEDEKWFLDVAYNAGGDVEIKKNPEVATKLKQLLLSLFTLLTQVVFKHIDHPGYRVTAIITLHSPPWQRALPVPVATESCSSYR